MRPGRIYALCSVDPPGIDPMDVNLAISTDGGATFASPVRVNTDPPHEAAWQWFGTMSIAPDGRLDVVWNDTRQSLVPRLNETYYRYSRVFGGK